MKSMSSLESKEMDKEELRVPLAEEEGAQDFPVDSVDEKDEEKLPNADWMMYLKTTAIFYGFVCLVVVLNYGKILLVS